MEPSKDSKTSQQAQKEQSFYDLIQPEQLELLYKKNAHLLDRLSKTGRENTLLHIKLSSINKEKIQLGNKTAVLKNKHLLLKNQISLFARQHRKFNSQSKQLKTQLEKAYQLKEPAKDSLLLSALKKEVANLKENLLSQKEERLQLNVLRKKEQVFIKQVETLQKLIKEERQKNLQQIQNRPDREEISLKKENNTSKLQKNYKTLKHFFENTEKQKFAKYNKSVEDQIKRLKAQNREKDIELKKQQKENKQSFQFAKNLEEKNGNFKKQTKLLKEKLQNFTERENKLRDLNQSLQERVKDAKNENLKLENQLQIKEISYEKILKESQKIKAKGEKEKENLKEQKALLSQESRKINSFKKEILELKKNEKDFKAYQNQISDLKKQKAQLKFQFTEQSNLLSKQLSFLKFQSENMKKALNLQKTGFEQAMLSFQRKYFKLYEENRSTQKQYKQQLKTEELLNKQISQIQDKLSQTHEENLQRIKEEKDKQIQELFAELTVFKDRSLELENQQKELETKLQNNFLKEKSLLQKKIRNLQYSKHLQIQQWEEKQNQETESLKKVYETQFQNLEQVWSKKLIHFRIEMENDLCGEKKRFEVFKKIKEQETKELKENQLLLQKENQELKSSKFVLEKSLLETKSRIDKYSKDSLNLKAQNEKLSVLWQELQKRTETQNQQIRSLQKLNQSLSVSLNEIKNKKNEKATNKPEKDLGQTIPHVLADIHFE